MFHVVQLSAGLDEIRNLLDGAFDSSRDLVNILRLHDGLQIVLEDFGKVVCSSQDTSTAAGEGSRTLQVRATEILQNLFPVGRIVIAAQVRLELAAENLQRSTLANTVCSHKTEDLAGAGHRKPVELEAVGRVAMGDFRLQVGGQVDDVDGAKGTFLRTDTASNAKAFGDEGDLGLRSDFDAKLAGTNDGARLLTFLAAFLHQLVKW